MGLFSNRISREEVKAGDHIYSWRTAYVYAHHGIYVGDGKVIHFTRRGGRDTETGTFLDKMIVSSSTNIPRCLICGVSSSSDGVITSCLDCFLAGGNLYLYRYNVSWASFLAKPRGGTCTLAPSDPPEDVLYRANFLLRRNGFGDYDVIDNNCETFSLYCKTGLLVFKWKVLGMSGQATSARAAWCAALVVALGGSPVVGIGTFCFGRLVGDIGMSGRKDVMKVPVESLVTMLSSAQISARKVGMIVSYC